MIQSKALEINLARTQVDVTIDPHFSDLQEVMERYFGLLEGLNGFLKEVSHPFKNWQYIVDGTRGYALDHFHLIKNHTKGPKAASLLAELFMRALTADSTMPVKVDAADNLIVFLQKIIKTTGPEFHRFEPLITSVFEQLSALPEKFFLLFVRSFYSLKRLGELLYQNENRPSDATVAATCHLLLQVMDVVCNCWLAQDDPGTWFTKEIEGQNEKELHTLQTIFSPIAHDTLQQQQEKVHQIALSNTAPSRRILADLIGMMDHNDIQKVYREVPQQLAVTGGGDRGRQWQTLFLFHIMNIADLTAIHEDTLRSINRTLNWLITHQNARQVQQLVRKTFSILGSRADDYPGTALSCILNIGRSIHTTPYEELFDEYINAVIHIGFQTPKIRGVSKDWQIKVNSAHIQNIRTWLEIIELNPRRGTRLLSNLIIYIAVCGTFIRDTDLFGRDVTQLLNSDIAPVYNLTKQLARMFPVYFNDIGAEGELRDISTKVDELCHRRDPLIHFLRKQSHVEGSNRILVLMEAAVSFWMTRNKDALIRYLPPDILSMIQPESPYVRGFHRAMTIISNAGFRLPEDLLTMASSQIEGLCSRTPDLDEVDRQRIVLFAEFYKQLNKKYNLDAGTLNAYVNQLPVEAFPEIRKLKRALAVSELRSKISRLLKYLELLKNIILSPEKYEIREDIYKKRHFTVDIPSMYGSYHELKFDAMGLTLRLEALVNVLFEELINTIDLGLITKATCHQIADRLKLFDQALRIDGMASAEFHQHLDLLDHSLEVRGFSFTQYLDIFKGFSQAVKNIINDYFNNIHGEHLTRILARLPRDQIQEKYIFPADETAQESEKQGYRISEIFFRDRLATSLGLQQLDLFLSRILHTMFHQLSRLPREHLRRLLNYDPERAISALYSPNHLADGIIHLGNKGLNLVKLNQMGLPVPPGFIVTTEVFRCREIITSFRPAQENFKEQVIYNIKKVEKITGKAFGDASNPLLLSVRSGSSISQPGMMDTFLNVGMNEAITNGLSERTGNKWFAWDNYRRFLQCYGMGLGLERDDFDAIINQFKQEQGISLKRNFSGDHMQQLAVAYKSRILDAGYVIHDDPLSQLMATIQHVMNSWESDKAKAYRSIMGISDDWGTAITVQAMVFGNLSTQSGAGVIFTHNPRWTGERLSLWGDFTLENQGEDVVAGLVQTLPISIRQQENEYRETDITMESHFPEIYKTLKQWAQQLVGEKGWGPQEMEFTFESPHAEDLFLLQTRDMGIREQKRVRVFDPQDKQSRNYLGHGIGVSAGALSGRLVFTLEEVDHWRQEEPKTALILARADTAPDDIREIHAADGLLTARGGTTSHAAVVAHRLGKTCVTGCSDMLCDETRRTISFGEILLRTGDYISIDGREGSVYKGQLRIEET